MLSPTAASPDTNCATGCPTCGCSNPNCRYGTIAGGQFIVIPVVTGWFGTVLIDEDRRHREMREFAKRLRVSVLRYVGQAWLVEARAIPRRMKRPFPVSRPRPPRAHWHPARTVRHRRYRSIRRLWRNAGRR